MHLAAPSLHTFGTLRSLFAFVTDDLSPRRLLALSKPHLGLESSLTFCREGFLSDPCYTFLSSQCKLEANVSNLS